MDPQGKTLQSLRRPAVPHQIGGSFFRTYKAGNNMKNMQAEVREVTVGHLSNVGTFAFPAGDTDINYERHNDNADNTTVLNGGVRAISDNALYNKAYCGVAPIGGSVTDFPVARPTPVTETP